MYNLQPSLLVLTPSLAYSGAMDIALALLPWKIFWTLRMSSRQEKLAIILAMSMCVLYVC